MIRSTICHSTFAVERTYLATPSRVFAVFTADDARNIWGDPSDVEALDEEAAGYELDFRVGGRERICFRSQDTIYHYESHYYDIVPDQRIVYCYELYVDGARESVSLVTIEFAKHGDGTALIWTEQGAYLDGIHGPGIPAIREKGIAEILDNLASYLNSRTPG
jgi:uncharacterized protein YndB with AHSA1/START domain